MNLELVNYINLDIKWNPVKKGRRSTTRLPRKPWADGSKFSNKIQDPSVNEIKSGVDVIGRHFSEKVSDAPLKKRRLLRQSPSPPPETRCRSESPLKLTKNEVSELDDFSGIELLAAAACSSLIHDKSDHFEFPMLEEHTKETIVSTEPDGSSVKDSGVPSTHGNEDRRVASSKGVRFHWDLNTVMDEWEEPCYDLPVESRPKENCSEGVFNGESSASKTDLVDSLIVSTSNPSVLQEQNMIKDESETVAEVQDGVQSPKFCKSYSDKDVIAEDPLSDGCGSNVTQDEQGHMADGDTLDNIQAGYDSPFEDGELREKVEERRHSYYESDNINEDDFGTVEYPLSKKIEVSREIGQTVENRNSLLVKEVNDGRSEVKADTTERKNGCDESKTLDGNLLHIDGSTAFDVCRNGAYVRRSRSGNIGDSYSHSRAERENLSFQGGGPTRVWDLKSSHEYHRPKHITRSLDNNQSRNYNPRPVYTTFNRKPSPSQKTDTYGSGLHRGSHRARSGFHPQEHHETRRFSPSFNRPARRSRSRSRSGSPIAWNFQKRRNSDTKKQSPDHEARPPFQTSVRLKSEDHFRFARRPGRCPKDDRFRYGVDKSFEDRGCT